MKKLSLVTLASVATMSFSTAAFAGEEKKHDMKMKGDHHIMKMKGDHHKMKKKHKHHAMYILMDKDGNGAVSAKEFKDFRAGVFAKADKNSDGNLNAEEFAGLAKIKKVLHKKAMKMVKQKKAQKRFSKVDADGDGTISKAEFDAKGDSSFTRMDKNDDGVLNKKDRYKGKQKMKKTQKMKY